MNNQVETSVKFVYKDPRYGNDTPSPSKIAPPPPRPKNSMDNSQTNQRELPTPSKLPPPPQPVKK